MSILFEKASNELYAQQKRSREEWETYTKSPIYIAYREAYTRWWKDKLHNAEPVQPFHNTSNVDYNYIDTLILDAIKGDGFSEKQAAYIAGYAIMEKHANYNDVIDFARSLCEFSQGFLKLNSQ